MKKPRLIVGCAVAGVIVVSMLLAPIVRRGLILRGILPILDYSDKPYVPAPLAVYPSSSKLQQSVIVPTLDTKMPKGKNVIWCASFQLAWDRLGKDVLHGPPAIEKAEDVAERLNHSKFSETDVPSDCYYAAAGWSSKGIVKEIRREMQQRFHRTPTIAEIDDPTNAIVTYGYLEVSIPFPIHYFENPIPMAFKDSENEQTNVRSFGVNFSRESIDDGPNQPLCRQVRVLHCALEANKIKTAEFVIDPCRESSPNQVLLAYLPAEATLQATWSSLEKRMANYPRQANADESFDVDELLVPSLAWDITHHFAELEGTDKRLKNNGFVGFYVSHAIQGIRFRLDRGGVELQSEASEGYKAVPREFVFNRPFFIFVRKRGGGAPFFAMYVANAELLCKP